jgi:uncharacterized protein (TIGR01244 family)
MTPSRAFFIAMVAGVVLVLGYAAFTRTPTVAYKELQPGVFVGAQIVPADMAALRANGFNAVIDLRPDGEAPDQPPSTQMAAAAQKAGLAFSYTPTPHGAVPGVTVDQFAKALSESARPTLLYCRSGTRAARVWALSEASRVGGLEADAILRAVAAIGLSADDVRADTDARIARRGAP